ncbi:hypothetical protein ACQKWADRAFT_129689 [Trichoderma austrokoningii]
MLIYRYERQYQARLTTFPVLAFPKQRQEKATEAGPAPSWLGIPTGHRQGRRWVDSTWHQSQSCEHASVTCTHRQADASTVQAYCSPRGGGAARWSDPWPQTGIDALLTRFATHGRAGQSSDRRGFWTAMVMVGLSASCCSAQPREPCDGLLAWLQVQLMSPSIRRLSCTAYILVRTQQCILLTSMVHQQQTCECSHNHLSLLYAGWARITNPLSLAS